MQPVLGSRDHGVEWEAWEGIVDFVGGLDMDIGMRPELPICGVCKHDDEGGRNGEGAIGGKEEDEDEEVEVEDDDELMLMLLLIFWDPPVFPEFEEFKELGFVTIDGGLIPVDFWDFGTGFANDVDVVDVDVAIAVAVAVNEG
ncbi:hypothetical protein BGZ93_000290, partial [Podila epicladia]